ncbi:MAG: WbqC family protein [Verrucomicrobia bacterium]|nr:WbqC family protein [Verrucomicrobiota bacterium]
MILAAHQPQYLPWLGFFDKMTRADVFVLLDCPQYKKREFQNRNRIKSPHGAIWLTVPVLSTSRRFQRIRDVEINNTVYWRNKHWKSIEQHYRKAPFWSDHASAIQAFYGAEWSSLCDLNMAMFRHYVQVLGITTTFRVESEVGTTRTNTERLIELCKKLGATCYLSGAGGKDYMDESRFAQEGIELRYHQYGHPVYRQMYPDLPFAPFMCILDLLFNEGPGSLRVLRGETP